jgi:CRP/FNR family cyclic AMP-dependent transcriptional regulator
MRGVSAPNASRSVDPARLAALPVFASLADDACAEVAAVAQLVDVTTGAEVAMEGDFAYEFFAIEEGTAEVRKDDRVLARLGPGEFFGEIGLLVTGRRTASVVATSPLRLVAIFDQPFRRLERSHPDVAAQLREAVQQRWRIR